MEEFSSHATQMPNRNTQMSVMRATIMTWRSVASFLNTAWKMFSATEEPAMSR